jgi:NAD(P)H-dependent flavin oxidoreductase YrpB (nitropropane dioxygenase family)
MGKKFKTRITEMLDIDHPILCGGMQWVSRADFVAEICNAGGFGFITAETFGNPEDLREEIRRMRILTDRPFGVNISMLPEIGNVRERTLAFCEIVCEEGVKAVETAGRSPGPLIPMFREAGIKVIHKLTNVRHAESAQRVGVDAVALLGYGSGGHIGLDNVASFISIPLAVSRLDIPVIAAGCIADGKGFLGALAMGAEGILMGTRFFASTECPVNQDFKDTVIRTGDNETIVSMTSIRNPMRSASNKLTDKILELEDQGATLEEVVEAVRHKLGDKCYQLGDPETIVVPCGQVAGLINKVKSVREVIEDIVSEAEELLGRLNGMAIQ